VAVCRQNIHQAGLLHNVSEVTVLRTTGDVITHHFARKGVIVFCTGIVRTAGKPKTAQSTDGAEYEIS